MRSLRYNLDIHQFAQDVIENCEGPELLRAFWKAITKVTILDPTCGSGAFLFAALNILEPLYEACLDRMQVFLDELEHTRENSRVPKDLGISAKFLKTLISTRTAVTSSSSQLLSITFTVWTLWRRQ